MTVIPFVCIFIGGFIGFKKASDTFIKRVDCVTNLVLILLMLIIGMNIGANDSVISKLDKIGLNCAVIAICAIAFSIAGVWLVEKTILPLDEIKKQLYSKEISLETKTDIKGEKSKKT